MKVRVSYVGNVKAISGKDDEIIELDDGATLPHLLHTLLKKYERFSEVYDAENESLLGGYCIIVQNQLISCLTSIPKVKLIHGDSLIITPIVVGG